MRHFLLTWRMQMRAVSNYSEIHPFPADLSGNLFSQLFPWLQIFFIKCQTIIKYFSTIQIIILPVIYQVHGIFCFCKLFSFIFYPVKFQHFKHFLNVLSTFVIKKEVPFFGTSHSIMRHRGLEPRTTWLKVKCSTAWANTPYSINNECLYKIDL